MTHITLTTFVVFFALAAFGAVVFALAHFASRGAFSPAVMDDATTDAVDVEDPALVEHSDVSPHDEMSGDL